MEFLQKIAQQLLLVVQFILVFLFILFEEIIWEGIAKPIYQTIASLKVLQTLEQIINRLNRHVVLIVFTLLLLGVEGAGLVAGVFFVQGQMLLGGVLYIAKIPIAAFTFWLFKVSKSKLLSFNWFAWAYERLIAGIDWLKEQEIYQKSLQILLQIKTKIKSIFMTVKNRYFSKESRFTQELKSFYRYIKNFKNRKKND